MPKREASTHITDTSVQEKEVTQYELWDAGDSPNIGEPDLVGQLIFVCIS